MKSGYCFKVCKQNEDGSLNDDCITPCCTNTELEFCCYDEDGDGFVDENECADCSGNFGEDYFSLWEC